MSRSIKELLEITLENQQYFTKGLCQWVKLLHIVQLINIEEHTMLANYIDDNTPSVYSSIDRFKHRNSDYWWKSGDIKPRIKWIKKHIKRNN
jgi:hypothetical protein